MTFAHWGKVPARHLRLKLSLFKRTLHLGYFKRYDCFSHEECCRSTFFLTLFFWSHRLSELPRFSVKTSWISAGALNYDRRVDNFSTELAPNNSHPVFGTNSNPERTGRDPWVSAEHIFVYFLFFLPSAQQPLHSQWSKELLKERHKSKNTGCISVCGAKTQTAGLRYSEQAEHQQKTEWNLLKTPPPQMFTPDCF